MKVLELDAGNTRLKWRLRQQDSIIVRGELANNQCWDSQLPRMFDPLGAFDQAFVSVVSGSERHGFLASLLKDGFGVELKVAKTRATHQGLTIAYQTPEALGVDRWLAMLAAHHSHPDDLKIIIDSGTALTIDIVDNKGMHSGGFIVPGIELMKRSLQINTANLMATEDNASSVDPGKATLECINHGVLAMTAAMINSQLTALPGSVVYLTGGGSPVLQPHIKAECIYRPELVMDGLALAFKEN